MPTESSPLAHTGAAKPSLTLRTPKLGSTRARILLALLVVSAGGLFYGRATLFTASFGDTDDATRMVMVRDLLAGQAWFDHTIWRLQPPLGVEMHWSRLVDGALAGLILLVTPLAGAVGAEIFVRTAWPLFWLWPASLAAFAIAHRLGGRRAIGPAALLLLLSPAAFGQFAPGRVDHHDLQIVAVLAALAGALWMDRSPRAGWLAGIATGLLLTVGLEALLFGAIIGAAIAIRLVVAPATAIPARRYAMGLGATTALGFLAQTDPARWTAPACDALAVNLLAAVLIGAAGLAVTAQRLSGGGLAGPARCGAIAATGLATAAVYVGIDPACLHGPFADIDPRLYPIWLDLVREVQPLATLWSTAPEIALLLGGAPLVCLLVATAVVAPAPARRDLAWQLTLTLMAAAVALTFAQAVKGSGYAAWIGAPVAAAAVTLVLRRWRGLLLPTLIATLLLSPLCLLMIYHLVAAPTVEEAKGPTCDNTADFAALAALPPGLVLADVDLGPMILAFTPHAALGAPYHRMAAGILATHDLLDSPPGVAEPLVRQRGIAYVATCGTTKIDPPYETVPNSLYQQLKKRAPVAWLEPVPSSSPLITFRLRPEINALPADATP